ncbi:protein vestigial-like isoform X2 [Macrosteles quadrilineatus]|uniref:protein vestigial-like isoform X2 n=1 Tax=Macrosteles quadrilineatus TaxID=74068 RepID=UPI0023E23749|nr:protein vestigial-like isoform X2 [Macrosteles quadrilineatus]
MDFNMFWAPNYYYGDLSAFYELNVQQGYNSVVGAGSGGGSVGSGGGVPSPASPPTTSRHKDDQDHRDSDGRCEDDDDSDVASPGGSRATYMSANCVVFTHYTGDVASVVDQHFSRALSYSQDKASPGSDKECSPMSTRNFPPSFWNQESVSVSHGHEGLYGESMYHGATAHTPADPWHSHYQQYTAAAHHHRAVHDYHHHHHQHMAGYGGLLLPPSSRLPPHAQYPKTMDWNHRLHHDQSAHHLDPATSYASYPSMAGLDASSVQDPSKSDLYWF